MSAHAAHSPAAKRARRVSLHALLIALAVVLAWAVLPTGSASAAAPAVVQCNGTDNVGGGTVTCSVSATSTVTGTGTTTPSAGTSCGSQG